MFRDFTVFFLKGLIIGFFLISCSGGKNEDSKGGSGESPAGTESGGTAGTAGSASGATANTGDEGSGPSHWILSVPFQRIEVKGFWMGSPLTEKGRNFDEKLVQVTISKPFEMMTKEVTQSQWVQVMGENPSYFKSQEHCDDHSQNMCPNNPVEQVSWDDVQEFIGKLNEALALSGCDGTPGASSGCYRLPTEAEWEYATRAGVRTAYSYGHDPDNLEDYAWFIDNAGGQTRKVGQKQANPWGLYDVHGNVWEWTQDIYAITLPGGNDPLNASGSRRVNRGGGWISSARYLRSAFRNHGGPANRNYSVGFRLVRTL